MLSFISQLGFPPIFWMSWWWTAKAIIPHVTWSFFFFFCSCDWLQRPCEVLVTSKTKIQRKGKASQTLGILTIKTVSSFLVSSVRNEVEIISLYMALWTILNYGARGIIRGALCTAYQKPQIPSKIPNPWTKSLKWKENQDWGEQWRILFEREEEKEGGRVR